MPRLRGARVGLLSLLVSVSVSVSALHAEDDILTELSEELWLDAVDSAGDQAVSRFAELLAEVDPADWDLSPEQAQLLALRLGEAWLAADQTAPAAAAIAALGPAEAWSAGIATRASRVIAALHELGAGNYLLTKHRSVPGRSRFPISGPPRWPTWQALTPAFSCATATLKPLW